MVGIVLGILAALVTGAGFGLYRAETPEETEKRWAKVMPHLTNANILQSYLNKHSCYEKRQCYHSFILLYPQLHWQKIACLTSPIVVHVIIVWIYFPWETTDVVRQHLHIFYIFIFFSWNFEVEVYIYFRNIMLFAELPSQPSLHLLGP